MLCHQCLERAMRCAGKGNLRLLILFGLTCIVLMLTTRSETPYVSRPSPASTVSYVEQTTEFTTVPEEEISVAPGFFNTSYLLEQTVKELESDGWVAPLGVGGIAKRIYKLKMSMRNSNILPSAVTNPAERVLYHADRWKVNYLGCFRYDPKAPLLIPVTLKEEVTSVSDCVLKCDNKRFSYAAISLGKLCACGKSMSTRPRTMERAQPTEFCNMNCKSKGDRRPCGGKHFTSVYKIKIHRKETLALTDIHEISDGCFTKPKNFDDVFKKKFVLVNGTAAHCLIYCERSFEPIAAWDSQFEQCMCGKYDSRLPVQRLQKIQNSEYCDKKYCNTMKKCKVRYLSSMRTYAHDKRCDSKTFLFGRNGTRCALASFPGSGNTWVRHLIECATGIYSGSIYNDLSLYEQGFLGEILPWNSMRTSVIKTHDGTRKGASRFDTAIVLIRNPYDAFLAEYNRVAAGHVGYASPEFFKLKEWTYFVIYKLTKWLSVITYFSEVKKVHVTYFEDVVSNPIDEARTICQFLQIYIPNLEERLQCLITSTGGDFKRPKRKLGFDPFTPSMKKNINLFVKKGREILLKRGLSRLPHYERV